MTEPNPIPISASLEMAATPDQVWAAVSDLKRMPEFSPELRKVILLGARGGLGQRMIGINRRKAVAWPTTSKVVRWEPGAAIAWHTAESGATWIYEIDPTDAGCKVTSRRVLPGYTLASRLMTPILGGAHGHDHELAAGMVTTLERIKAAVER